MLLSIVLFDAVVKATKECFYVDHRYSIIIIETFFTTEVHLGHILDASGIGFREDLSQCQLHSFRELPIRNGDIIEEYDSEPIVIRTGEGIIGEQDGKVTLLGPGPHPFKRNASGWVFVIKVQSEHLLLLEVILTSLAIFEGRRAERIPATSHNKSKLLHVDRSCSRPVAPG